MIKPTIHLNGSSSERLLEGYCDASLAITRALDKLTESAPNARDYYPQGDEAFALARSEHSDRIKRLTSVQAELRDLAEHVADERDNRKESRS